MALKSTLLKIAVVLATIGSMIQPRFVLADDINAGGLPIKNITIEKVEGDRLYYKTQSGTASDKQINDRMKLTVTDEPNLIPAEDAFAAGKWADAVDGYQKVLRTGAKVSGARRDGSSVFIDVETNGATRLNSRATSSCTEFTSLSRAPNGPRQTRFMTILPCGDFASRS